MAWPPLVVPSNRVPPEENNVATWLPLESFKTTCDPLTVQADTEAASPGQPRDAARNPPDHLVLAINIWQDEPDVVTFQAPTSASSETAGPVAAEATCVPAAGGMIGAVIVPATGALGSMGALGNWVPAATPFATGAIVVPVPTGAKVPC